MRYAIILIILLSIGACQPTVQEITLPTRVPSITAHPTHTATPIITATLPLTSTPPPTIASTRIPLITILPERTLVFQPVTPTPVITVAPLLPETFIFGYSVSNRPLIGRRIGTGDQQIMLVGGIHGGWESNTVDLIEALIRYFEDNPRTILPDISFLFIPALNPDGVLLGRDIAGRFNANGVDLNRNWACGWSTEAYFRDELVSAGTQPFSEPESQALAALINDVRPHVVLFYHSAANGVFAGDCEDQAVSAEMAAVYGEASGYVYEQPFTDYVVTGTAANWVDGLGIPSADVELSSSQSIDFERNLNGILSVQCWLAGLMVC